MNISAKHFHRKFCTEKWEIIEHSEKKNGSVFLTSNSTWQEMYNVAIKLRVFLLTQLNIKQSTINHGKFKYSISEELEPTNPKDIYLWLNKYYLSTPKQTFLGKTDLRLCLSLVATTVTETFIKLLKFEKTTLKKLLI